ncbi:uncharacterized protein LOC110913437 [Helianthus annuus]|uniref:uncharacterized protein LOC110913437 n=1 Tax=Helianthus annuus TaxID=4232 RepID=UPI000B90656C|nr:uncharacterized protein LOC110913437 [Helianthus annuus]
MRFENKKRNDSPSISVFRCFLVKKRPFFFFFIFYSSKKRQLIWDSLEGRGLPGKYIDIIKDTYDRTETSVRAPVGDTNFFPVEVGLHQGSALSPFLFAVVLDELSKLIQEPVPWCMLFVDDIVLIAETKQCLNARIKEWRVALEGKGLRISRSKTEYLHCDFSGVADDDDTQITIEDQLVPEATKFKYLGSFVQRDCDIDSDVTHRIQAGWCRWRATSGVLCNRRFPTKLKGKFYRVAVRPAMLYGTDCWAIKKTQARKMEVAEMRMLRWMCGHTRLDRIRNERRQTTTPFRVVETLTVERRRGRDRPKLTWEEQIRHDLLELHLSEDMVQDRTSWRRRIRVKDF